jgi:hypothetical protein
MAAGELVIVLAFGYGLNKQDAPQTFTSLVAGLLQ